MPPNSGRRNGPSTARPRQTTTAAASSSSSASRSTSSIPNSLRAHQPLSTTQQGRLHVQKPNHRNTNAGPSNPLSRLNIQNVTGEASSTAITLGTSPLIKMEDVKIKDEIKSEPGEEVMDLNQIQAQSGNGILTPEMFNKKSPAHKNVLYLRHRIQGIAKSARERGGLPSQDAVQLQNILKTLNTFPWEDGIYEDSKIGKATKLVCEAKIFGDVISSRAQALLARWNAGDFSPGVFPDEADELVDSGDDYETSASEDDDPPRPSPGLPLSHGQQVTACVEQLKQGMIIKRDGKRKSYLLDPRARKIPADRFGHNGLTVGDWWPFQGFTLKDGAHGSKMGGIYGKVRDGAYSIVISGGTYDENDSDSGDRILYSGSKGGENEDAKTVAPYTTATQCLITSSRSNQPVRVFRSSRCTSRWRPSAGIRYDGLYNVEGYSIQKDKKENKFYQFTLVRSPNQPPIDMNRPTPLEVAAYERIKAI